jgi:hypothetical protein
MPKPLVVIIRFSGDSADLLARFDRARRLWIEAQDGAYERPVFYAACKTDEGIAILSGWESSVAHRAFGQGIHPHIHAAGMAMPDGIDRMRVEKLGWD